MTSRLSYETFSKTNCAPLETELNGIPKISGEKGYDFCFRAVLYTCRQKNWQLLRNIIENVNSKPILEILCNVDDEPPVFALIKTNNEEDNDVLKLLASQGLVPILSGNKQNQLFHHAVTKGNHAAISILYGQGHKEFLNCVSDKLTPLVLAMRHRPEMLPALFKVGAHSALHTSVLEMIEYTETTRSTLKISSSIKQKNCQLSSFAFTVREGNIRSLEQFVTEGITEWSDIIDGVGNLLHLAILSKPEMLEHLLVKFRVYTRNSLNAKSQFGEPPLIFAIKQKKGFAVSALLERGANPNCRDINGRTPLHWCALTGLDQYVATLKDYGADINLTDSPEKSGKTPILLAESLQHRNVVDQLTTCTPLAPKPDFKNDRPLALAIQGGGAKGLGYIGAIRVLEEAGLLRDVERIAGTSAGAISAALIAMGCTCAQMREYLAAAPLNEILLGKPFWKNPKTALKMIPFVLDPLKALNPQNILKTLWRSTGAFDGEIFRKWMEEKIHAATGIAHCTFGELNKLVVSKQRSRIGNQTIPFRHLHIFGIRIENEPALVDFRSEFYKGGDEWMEHVIISDAVRISMSIPMVFRPHYVHIKLPGLGQRVRVEGHGAYVDGGLLKNFPLDTFDSKRYMKGGRGLPNEIGSMPIRNPHTLGLALVPPPENVRTKSDMLYDSFAKDFLDKCVNCPQLMKLAAAVGQVNYNSESLLKSKDADNYDKDRVINISTEGVGMLDFNLNDEEKEKLIGSGRSAVMTSGFFRDLSHLSPIQRRSNVSSPTKHFQGFINSLQKLKSALDPTKWKPKVSVNPVLLIGKEKVGKSELARQFVEKNKQQFCGTYWIDNENREKQHLSYIKIANLLSISMEDTEAPGLERAVLDELQENTLIPWLLIFDNVADFTKVNYPKRGGLVLCIMKNDNTHTLTSKNSSVVIEDGLSSIELSNIVRSIAGLSNPDESTIEKVIGMKPELSCPLQFSFAGAYMKLLGCDFPTYYKEITKFNYEHEALIVASSKDNSNERKIPTKSVSKEKPPANKLLQFLRASVFFDCQKLHKSWFEYTCREDSRCKDMLWLNEFVASGLLYHDAQTDTYSMHQRLQKAIKKSLSDAERTIYYRNSCEWMRQQDSLLPIFPHLRKIIDMKDDFEKLNQDYRVDLLLRLAVVEMELGQYNEGLCLCDRVYEIDRKRAFDFMETTAKKLEACRKYEEALKFYEKIYLLRENIYRMDSLVNILLLNAESVTAKMKYIEASKFYHTALEISEKKINNDDPSKVSDMRREIITNIAVALEKAGVTYFYAALTSSDVGLFQAAMDFFKIAKQKYQELDPKHPKIIDLDQFLKQNTLRTELGLLCFDPSFVDEHVPCTIQ